MEEVDVSGDDEVMEAMEIMTENENVDDATATFVVDLMEATGPMDGSSQTPEAMSTAI